MSTKPCFIFTTVFLALLMVGSFTMNAEGAGPLVGPGTLTTIPPDVDYTTVYNRSDLVELLAELDNADPDLADDIRFKADFWAKNVRFQRDIWCLEFSFKPVRIVFVDIPNKEGTFDKKAVWYMVYNVKNPGAAELEKVKKTRTVQTDSGDRTIESTEFNVANPGGSLGTTVSKELKMPIERDTSFSITQEGERLSENQTRDTPLEIRNLPGFYEPRSGQEGPIRFVPQFLLATDRLTLETISGNDPETGRNITQVDTSTATYVDQVIPLAIPQIMKREDMKDIPETTVSIARKEIQPGQDLWGVAMWTDVDSRINRFSIFASGLTNAYRWSNDPEATSAVPGEGRSMKRKVLKTNWWRIGDQHSLKNAQIHFGFPEDRNSIEQKDVAVVRAIRKKIRDDEALSEEEDKFYQELLKKADLDKDGVLSDGEIELYYRNHLRAPDYEWVFL